MEKKTFGIVIAIVTFAAAVSAAVTAFFLINEKKSVTKKNSNAILIVLFSKSLDNDKSYRKTAYLNYFDKLFIF